jgi:acyl-coenzyme A synthetase/AMP-(fatty) acid ligase
MFVGSWGTAATDVSQILARLPQDPYKRSSRRYRIVESSDPAQCTFHLLAGWLAGQVVVLAGAALAHLEPALHQDADYALPVYLTDSPQGLEKSVTFDDLVFPRPADAPAVLIASSGTTGVPKGIVHSRANVLSTTTVLTDIFAMRRAEGHVFGNLSPFHGLGGLRGAMMALRHDVPTIFFPPRPDNGLALARDVLQSECTTVLSGSSFVRLLASMAKWLAGSPTALRSIMSCGSLYDDRASAIVRERYGIELVHSYGQSETAGIVMSERPGTYRPGLMPPPMAGVVQHFRARDDGDVAELGIAHPMNFLGYLGDTTRRQAEVVWTGDLVRKTPEGLKFLGREAHAIKTADATGWLFPDRVESWLRDVAGFADAAVRPLPDHSRLLAVIVAKALPDTLEAQLVADLGSLYKGTRLCIGTVERTANGKLLKMEPMP